MGNSYSRKCRNCGRWINLRQMPHGRYVAFEGDQPHNCKKPVVVKAILKPGRAGGLNDPEFPDVVVPGANTSQPDREPLLVTQISTPRFPGQPNVSSIPQKASGDLRSTSASNNHSVARPASSSSSAQRANTRWWVTPLVIFLVLALIRMIAQLSR